MFRVGAARARGSGSIFCALLILLPGVFPIPPPSFWKYTCTNTLTLMHTHTLSRMTAQLGCVRGAQAGVVWSVCMRVCGRICGEVCVVCVYVCVCARVWSGCVVSGAGLGRACWRLGWEKSRCVYFTLGAVHGHGNTAQTPLYNTSMYARTHVHAHTITKKLRIFLHKSHVTHHHKHTVN